MKQTPSQNLRLGIFVLLGSLVFIGAIYFVGNKQSMFGHTARLYARFNNVNGLQLGNNVRYSGIEIGTVTAIEMTSDTTIVISMDIDQKIMRHIRKNAIAAISSDGLVGSMVINIIPGNKSVLPVSDGDTIKSYSRIRTEDILKTLNVTNENAALLTADLLKISNEILEGKGSIGILLRDTIMGNDLKATVRYLKITGMETAATVKDLDRIIASLQQKDNVIGVLNDTVMATKLRHLVNSLDQSGTNIQLTVAKLDALVTDTKNGKGAFHYLTQDPKSAQQIDSIMTHVNESSLLLKQDLEALQQNFLLRGYFRKQAKQSLKKETK